MVGKHRNEGVDVRLRAPVLQTALVDDFSVLVAEVVEGDRLRSHCDPQPHQIEADEDTGLD
jgi:hypothetical protein